ncbi:MAG: hypothetical protein EOP04_02150 [Proteobacteria bacterium]|nr:MAG: hypothetical protein EOP04_02150 [Pseudomonadota bacterium]
MKNRESGSAGAALILGLMTLGLASLYMKETQRSNLNAISKSKMTQEAELQHNAAMNAAALYKGLLMEKRIISSGQYLPALYALDYFASAKDWKMVTGVGLDSTAYSVDGSKVKMKAGSKNETSLKNSTEVLKGDLSAISATKEPVTVEIVNLTYAKEGEPGQGIVVRSADVKVVGKEKDGSDARPVSIRIPLPSPKPYDLKIMYQLKGELVWHQLTASSTLPDGEYLFHVKASGIALGVQFFFDGARYDLGFNADTGEITHDNRNYAARDLQIGASLVGDFTFESHFDPNSCAAKPEDGTHTVQAKLLAIDGSVVETSEIYKMKLDSNVQNLSLDAYKTQCIDKCDYVETTGITVRNPDGSIEGGDIANWWVNTMGAENVKIPDISGEFTWQESKRYKIPNKKLCMNFEGVTVADHGGEYFKSEKLMWKTYSVPGCKVEFLGDRKACGCVAEDTMILMGDGKSEKRIDQIVESDRIWNPLLKKSIAIKRMTRGPEKLPMLKIDVDGKLLSVTGNHPFPTRTGMRTAFTLSEGEEIILEGIGWKPIKQISAVRVGTEAPVVWNIEVDAPADDFEAHHYVANGVVTGDLLIQMNLQRAGQTAGN